MNAAAGRSSHEYGTTYDITYNPTRYSPAPDALPPPPRVDDRVPGFLRGAVREQLVEQQAEDLDRLAADYPSRLTAVLGRALIELEDEGVLAVVRERRQPVYHVTVARRLVPRPEQPHLGAEAGGAGASSPLRGRMASMPALDAPDDALLYGHDPAERIVALHPVGPATMRLYRRRSPAEVTTEDVRVHPFFFLSDVDLLRGFPRDRFQYQELAGQGFFRYVVAFPDRHSYFDALRHLERTTETEKSRPDEVYLPGSPEQQYLMQTGRTLFKGMDFPDLSASSSTSRSTAPPASRRPRSPSTGSSSSR